MTRMAFTFVFHTDGSLFNLRCLQAHTKTKKKLTRSLLSADDAALVAHIESAMQRITSCIAEAAQLFGLEVSLKKTEFSISSRHKKSNTHPASP